MRVLVTGISGVGKSSLVGELRRRGYSAFDADDDGFSAPSADGSWSWELEAVREMLRRHDHDLVFFAGCSDEQAALDWDFKVLLSAPVEVVMARLQRRTSNPFGKSRADRERVLADMEWVLPLIRGSADLEIDTSSKSPEAVADAVLAAVAGRGGTKERL